MNSPRVILLGGFLVLISLLLPGSNRFLSLDDARTYASISTNSPRASIRHDPKFGWHLLVEEAYNYHTERERGMQLWETRTAEEMAEPAGLTGVPFERIGFYPLQERTLPITILIPLYGILQIGGIERLNLPSVVIQYKRVVAGETNAAKSAGIQARMRVKAFQKR